MNALTVFISSNLQYYLLFFILFPDTINISNNVIIFNNLNGKILNRYYFCFKNIIVSGRTD